VFATLPVTGDAPVVALVDAARSVARLGAAAVAVDVVAEVVAAESAAAAGDDVAFWLASHSRVANW